MIDEHFCASFHLAARGEGPGEDRRWDETAIIPIALGTWDELRAGLPAGADDEALHRAAFEHARPLLYRPPYSVQFYRKTRVVAETLIGPISFEQHTSEHSPVYWLDGQGPLDADALEGLMPSARHAIERLRETGGRVILINGILHEVGPADHRVDWEEARRPAEPSHRLLTVEGGYHPIPGQLGL